MVSGISKVGNVLKTVVKNEVGIIKDSKRAGQIAKELYPDKKMAQAAVTIKKLTKDVGPEPVIGLLVGTYSNPIPGLSVVGYLFGRGLAEGRKFITKLALGSVKKAKGLDKIV